MAIVEVTTATFEAEVLKSDIPVLLDLWAPWCGPCKALTPIIEKLEAEVGDKAKICKLNIDENPEIASKYSIMSIPTLLIFSKGVVAEQLVGLMPQAKIMAKLQAHL